MKRFTSGATRVFTILVGSILLASILSAEELTAVRIKEGPKVDGLLTDPAWQSAFAITGFRMVEPRPGEDHRGESKK